jgi:hypothetical protein
VKIGAKTVLLPECGHAYGAARWEAARWYGQALPVRIIHMTEFLDEKIVNSGDQAEADRPSRHLPRSLPDSCAAAASTRRGAA